MEILIPLVLMILGLVIHLHFKIGKLEGKIISLCYRLRKCSENNNHE